uniref:Uncharacterized protein n=1 Tax=Gouania willdenowi TaxID=441366 RepID=A0A8C5DSS2_GOUWI
WRDVSVGILLVTDDGLTTDEDLHLSPLSSSLIVEGGIILDDMKSLPQALLLVFGLIYSLNLEYFKLMKNTLNFIQMVILGLGGNKLPPKLQLYVTFYFPLIIIFFSMEIISTEY